MKTISATYLRTHSARVLAEVQEAREAVIVTKRGLPIARIEPVRRSYYGIAKNEILSDFTEDMFATGVAWEADS
jgi:prevent-host-death family protein